MYKYASEFSQRVQVKGPKEPLTKNQRKQLKAEINASKRVPKAAIKLLKGLCPICQRRIPSTTLAVQNHFKRIHKKILSEAEAYRIASNQKVTGSPYTEDFKKPYNEISGGLPSLGKKR